MVGKPHRLAFWTTATCRDIFFDWQYCISGEVKYSMSFVSSDKVVAEGILAKKMCLFLGSIWLLEVVLWSLRM